MRLDGIHIENFLSFERLEWTNLDPRLNLIVGPNGAGKTNFIHAMRAVLDKLNYMRRSELPWEQSFHRGATTRAIRIALDVEFTGAWERQLFRTFVNAALCDALKRHQHYNANPVHHQELPGLSAFLEEHIQSQDLEWLFSGRLVVTYGETNNRWHSWYESRPGEPFFQLLLDAPTGSSMLIGDEVLPRFLNQLITQGWHPTILLVEPSPVQSQQAGASPEQEGPFDALVSIEALSPTESPSEYEMAAVPVQEKPGSLAEEETQPVTPSAAEVVVAGVSSSEKTTAPSQPEPQFDISSCNLSQSDDALARKVCRELSVFALFEAAIRHLPLSERLAVSRRSEPYPCHEDSYAFPEQEALKWASRRFFRHTFGGNTANHKTNYSKDHPYSLASTSSGLPTSTCGLLLRPAMSHFTAAG